MSATPPTLFADLDPESHAAKVIAAADLIRSEGYVIVMAVERDHWDRWRSELWAEQRKERDTNQRLIWEVHALQNRIRGLLGETRPRWWRGHLAWWKRYGYTDPIVFGPRGET